MTGPTTFAQEKTGNALKTLGLDALPHVVSVSEDTVDGKQAISAVVGTPLNVRPKGANTWVPALWKKHADAGQLVFKGQVSDGRLPSIKESATSAEYRGVWLKAHGFGSLKDLGAALEALLKANPGAFKKATLPEARTAAANFTKDKLGGSQVANIDHIVEKQVGGTSIAENMQILNAEENQESGRRLNDDIVAQGEEILAAAGKRSGKQYLLIRLRYPKVNVQASKSVDTYDEIERLLRDKTLVADPADAKTGAAPTGTPTRLKAGAAGVEILLARGAGKGAGGATAIAGHPQNDVARRLVSGLDLQTYRPGAGKTAPDQVEAAIDSSRLKGAIQGGPGKKASVVLLDALAVEPPAGESTATRQLKISGKSKELDFVFPYLSPGRFTRLELAADDSLEAEGYITPSLKFLKRLDVRLAKDSFALKGNLGPENFQPPFRGFKVTESSLSLQLAPELRPSGTFGFQIGPEQRPYAVGSVNASLDGTAIVLDGTLEAKHLPGVDRAVGTVRFHQAQGWSGELKATTSRLPKTKRSEVTFGFRTDGGATQYYAGGAIELDVGAGKDLTISADWKGDRLVYAGRLLWEKPIKLVDQVTLGFRYDGETLQGSGETAITYKSFSGRLKVHYLRKEGEDARLSGSGAVAVKTPKADGTLELNVDPAGRVSGKGSVSYAFSDKLRPTVGVALQPDGHLTLTGRIEVTKPIELFPRFPREGGERDLIKVNVDFIIPGPFPGLADPMVHLGAGVRFSYGIGPGQIVNTVIEGSFDPLEENKNAKLKLTSTLQVPGHVGLTGILEAGLGVAVLGGLAAKVHGGLRVEPGFTLNLLTQAPIVAEYDQGDFSFEGRIEMKGGLVMGLAIKLYAHVEAIGGALAKDFTYDVRNYQYNVGQDMTLTLARLGYSTKTGFKAPSLDDVRIQPTNVDPIAMIRRIGESARSALAGQG
jgi:hypothetical protein